MRTQKQIQKVRDKILRGHEPFCVKMPSNRTLKKLLMYQKDFIKIQNPDGLKDFPNFGITQDRDTRHG